MKEHIRIVRDEEEVSMLRNSMDRQNSGTPKGSMSDSMLRQGSIPGRKSNERISESKTEITSHPASGNDADAVRLAKPKTPKLSPKRKQSLETIPSEAPMDDVVRNPLDTNARILQRMQLAHKAFKFNSAQQQRNQAVLKDAKPVIERSSSEPWSPPASMEVIERSSLGAAFGRSNSAPIGCTVETALRWLQMAGRRKDGVPLVVSL